MLEDQGLVVDLRHLLILADLMCQNGTVLSIGRHGISGSKSSVFARAAFEVTVNQLLDAGIYDEGGETCSDCGRSNWYLRTGFSGLTAMDKGKFSYKEDFLKQFNVIIYNMRKNGELQKILDQFIR